VPTLADAVSKLNSLFQAVYDLQRDLDRLTEEESAGRLEELAQGYYQQMGQKRREVREYLESNLLRYPPVHFKQHADALRTFHAAAPYEKSVFIMTKFPEKKTGKDKILSDVIKEVQESIHDAGFVPRLATYEFHGWLWQNVELYLLGCARGVAIVEDRVRKEMNPNVAFEWGWMKGMGKRVFFLMEQSFAHTRADWNGLITKSFSWKNPKEGVREALTVWLTKKDDLA
jgi:hypothetical protein